MIEKLVYYNFRFFGVDFFHQYASIYDRKGLDQIQHIYLKQPVKLYGFAFYRNIDPQAGPI